MYVLGGKTCRTRSVGIDARIAMTPNAERSLTQGMEKKSELFGKKHMD